VVPSNIEVQSNSGGKSRYDYELKKLRYEKLGDWETAKDKAESVLDNFVLPILFFFFIGFIVARITRD